MSMLGYYRDNITIKNIILDLAAKNRQVVYGQQSINAQLPERYRRETKDYDILTKNSKKSAEELAEKLNQEYHANKFKVVPAKHKGTFKVKDIDDTPIADYTQTTKKPHSKIILGVKYSNIKYQQKKLKGILNKEEYSYRHEKDKATLSNIKQSMKNDFLFGGL